MKPSEFELFFYSVLNLKSCDNKTANKCKNCNIAKEFLVFKLLTITISNFNRTNYELESRLCQNFTALSLIISEK